MRRYIFWISLSPLFGRPIVATAATSVPGPVPTAPASASVPAPVPVPTAPTGPSAEGKKDKGPPKSVAQKFRAWQLRGAPIPITDLAEYFTLDGEDIRWGRWYRIGGLYTHILLW